MLVRILFSSCFSLEMLPLNQAWMVSAAAASSMGSLGWALLLCLVSAIISLNVFT